MEPVGGKLHLVHTDIVRQIPVHIVADFVRLQFGFQITVCNHRPGMHARVGSACADDIDLCVYHPAEDSL